MQLFTGAYLQLLKIKMLYYLWILLSLSLSLSLSVSLSLRQASQFLWHLHKFVGPHSSQYIYAVAISFVFSTYIDMLTPRYSKGCP